MGWVGHRRRVRMGIHDELNPLSRCESIDLGVVWERHVLVGSIFYPTVTIGVLPLFLPGTMCLSCIDTEN